MKITYIHHSSFLVEMEQIALLFDYFEGEIPEIRQDQLLIVFASHRHGDHFSPGIFDLAENHPKIWFVLSDDIWRKRVPEEFLCRTSFLGSGEEFSFQKETGEKVPVTVKAFKSTDEGVAFLIEAEGKVLYLSLIHI